MPTFPQPSSPSSARQGKQPPIHLAPPVPQESSPAIGDVREMLEKLSTIPREIITKEEQMFNVGSKISFIFNSVVWNHDYNAPKSLQLVIKFFNFHEFRSDPLGL